MKNLLNIDYISLKNDQMVKIKVSDHNGTRFDLLSRPHFYELKKCLYGAESDPENRKTPVGWIVGQPLRYIIHYEGDIVYVDSYGKEIGHVWLGFGNGGTKDAEYRRTFEFFQEIYKEKGLYFALALLYDCQYDREDIGKMMKLHEPKPKVERI